MVIAESGAGRPFPGLVADMEVIAVVGVAAGNDTFFFLIDLVPVFGIVELEGEVGEEVEGVRKS